MKSSSFPLFLLLLIGLGSCAYDNYEPPQSRLEGRIVYKGEPIQVEYNNVTFELWEPGWQLRTPINVTVDQDGSYAALLFDADYKLVLPPAQGPYRRLSDTTRVSLRGSQNLDIEVLPYYLIRNAVLTPSGRKITAVCQLEKIITDSTLARNVERISLYASKTQFVDSRTSVASTSLTGTAATHPNPTLSLEVPTLTPAQNYVFARIGVKIAGVEDLIFSPVQKIPL